jgi:hypothetical protein
MQLGKVLPISQRRTRVGVIALLLAIGLAACGDDCDSDASGTPSRAELQQALDELTAAGMFQRSSVDPRGQLG